jgi:aspartate/methionine/tyrosine aminotransferase
LKENFKKAVDAAFGYSEAVGAFEVRNKVAEVYSKKFNRSINSKKEIMIGFGANGCVSSIIN